MEENIADLLTEQNILWKPKLCSKKRIFEQVALLFESSDDLSREKVFRMLIERERLGSTAIGKGGAIPHVRLHGIKSPLCALVHLDKAISYGDAEEGNGAVHTLFFLITPTEPEKNHEKAHLVLLAAFAEILSDEKFMDDFDKCDDAGVAHNKIKEWCQNYSL